MRSCCLAMRKSYCPRPASAEMEGLRVLLMMKTTAFMSPIYTMALHWIQKNIKFALPDNSLRTKTGTAPLNPDLNQDARVPSGIALSTDEEPEAQRGEVTCQRSQSTISRVQMSLLPLPAAHLRNLAVDIPGESGQPHLLTSLQNPATPSHIKISGHRGEERVVTD